MDHHADTVNHQGRGVESFVHSGYGVSAVSTATNHAPWQLAWDYVRHELLYLSWAFMETSLITPLCLVLMGWARYWPPGLVLLWLLLLVLIPFNLLRLMDLMRFPIGWQQIVMVGGIVFALLFSSSMLIYHTPTLFDLRWVPLFFQNITQKGNQLWVRDVTIFLLAIVVWTRGTSLRHREFNVNNVGLFLRIGGLLLAPMIIWLGSSRRLLWDTAPFVLLFFMAGLTAVTLARAEEIEKRKTGFSASLTPRWLSLILIAVLAIVLLSALLAGIISGQGIFYIAAWLTPLWTALLFGATTIFATIAQFVFPLLSVTINALQQVMVWFVSTFGYPTVTPADTVYDDSQIISVQDLSQIAQNMNWFWKSFIFLLLLLAVFLVTLTLNYIYTYVRLARQKSEFAAAGPREFTEGESWGQRLQKRFGELWHWRTAVSIRHTYRQMCRAATVNGYPRDKAETPYEYLKTLRQVWPANMDDIQLITTAYIKIRYGEFPETEEDLNQIWQAWHRLQQVQPITITSASANYQSVRGSSRKHDK